VKGRGFRGALDYALGKDGAERIGGPMAGRNAREPAAEFRALRALRPDVERAVFHASLSAPVEERPTDRQWEAIADAYAERMSFGASAYVVVRHHDQAHEHVHVIASRVDVYGRVVSDAHDHYKGQEILRALEREHGLTRVAASWERGPEPGKQRTEWEQQQYAREVARYERTGARPFSDLVREHAPAAFREARSWDELRENVRAVGLELVPKRGGLAVQDPATGGTVKASAVGRECARSKLEQRFGVTYDEWQQGRTRDRQPDGRTSDRGAEHAAAGRSPDGPAPAHGAGRDGTAASSLVGPDDPSGDGLRRERGGERGGRGGVGRDRAAARAGGGGPGGDPAATRDGTRELGDAADRGAGGAGRGDGRGAGRGGRAGEDHERLAAARGRDDARPARAPGGLPGGGPGALADAVGVERDGGGVGVPGRALGAGGAARDRTGGALVGGPAGPAGAGGAGGFAGQGGSDERVGDGSLRQLAERLGRDLAQVEALAQERQRLAVALSDQQNRAAAAERAHHALQGTHAEAARAAERGYQAQLGAVYRDPEAAHRTLEARAHAAGWDVAVAELRAAPERFGALHGRGAGDGVAGRLLGDDATRGQARAAVPGLAGWAAERHAARAAERQAASELAGLADARTQAHAAAHALRTRREALPHEHDRLRAIGREVRGLARQFAPAELRQVEQQLTAPHRALLGQATALAKEALLGRDRDPGGVER